MEGPWSICLYDWSIRLDSRHGEFYELTLVSPSEYLVHNILSLQPVLVSCSCFPYPVPCTILFSGPQRSERPWRWGTSQYRQNVPFSGQMIHTSLPVSCTLLYCCTLHESIQVVKYLFSESIRKVHLHYVYILSLSSLPSALGVL